MSVDDGKEIADDEVSLLVPSFFASIKQEHITSFSSLYVHIDHIYVLFFAGGINVLPKAANPEVYLAFCLCSSRINNELFTLTSCSSSELLGPTMPVNKSIVVNPVKT